MKYMVFRALSIMLVAGLTGATVGAAELPRGQAIPDVRCAEDAAQGYALYVPSTYIADREWPVIFGFDPGGRGLNPVERYQAAAEKYGYIVAGSNNSRNGSWAVSTAAVTAMTRDVAARFNISAKREYVAGMSGGARVAFGVALSSANIAGVFASSAGYPDSRPRKELPFPVFESAGTEDFNYLEMRQIDRDLKTPHRLAIFEGGHMWLPPDLATEAVEWMELQAMETGRKARDQAEIDAINAAWAGKPADAAIDSKKQRDIEKKETETNLVIRGEETLLTDPAQRAGALKQLRQRWKILSETAKGPDDTPERRMARRVLGGLSASGQPQDPDYLAIVKEYRMARGGR